MIGLFAKGWYEPFSAKHLPAWSRESPLATRPKGSHHLVVGPARAARLFVVVLGLFSLASSGCNAAAAETPEHAFVEVV